LNAVPGSFVAPIRFTTSGPITFRVSRVSRASKVIKVSRVTKVSGYSKVSKVTTVQLREDTAHTPHIQLTVVVLRVCVHVFRCVEGKIRERGVGGGGGGDLTGAHQFRSAIPVSVSQCKQGYWVITALPPCRLSSLPHRCLSLNLSISPLAPPDVLSG
jgi:hypothetical protein